MYFLIKLDIVVLDDDQGRRSAMKDCLNRSFSKFFHVFFDNAPEMIEWLQKHLQQCVLISLDHDLGPNWQNNEELFDPGIGRDVVDYLTLKPPQCPVIIHSSNHIEAVGMEMALAEVNWTVDRVITYYFEGSSSSQWIDNDWQETISIFLDPLAQNHQNNYDKKT